MAMQERFDTNEVLSMLECEDSDDDFDGYIEENYNDDDDDISGVGVQDIGDDGDDSDSDSGGNGIASSCSSGRYSSSSSSGPSSSSSSCPSSSSSSGPSSSSSSSSSFDQTYGCNFDMSGKVPVDFAQLFLSDEILQKLVDETNLFADQFISSNDLPPRSRVREWKPCTLVDMKKFLALIIAMSVDSKHRIEDYWSTRWPFVTSSFSGIMKRDRFTLLLRFFHLNDGTKYIARGRPGYDALYKIRPLMEHLQKHFKGAYTPGREVAVDESMIGFKGRLWFIQYMPKKPTKWGMKAYVLADSRSGYTYSWRLYAGENL